jgi:hypothetical protein
MLLATGLECTPILAISTPGARSFVFTPYGYRQPAEVPPSLAFNGEWPEAPTGNYLRAMVTAPTTRY